MGVRDITAGACWAVAAATVAALLWSLLDTPPSWDARIFVSEIKFFAIKKLYFAESVLRIHKI
jgi:hypothetical protein